MSIKVSEIIYRVQSKTGLNQKEVGEQLFDKDKNTFNAQIRGNRLDWIKLFQWAVSKNIDLDWLILGKGVVEGPVVAEQQPPYCNHLTVTPEVLNLASMAIEVLKSDTHWASSLEQNIKSFYRGLASERGDRRVSDQPDKIPRNTGDRRKKKVVG